MLAGPAHAQSFWHVTAPPEVVLGWQPRTAEEAARGPLALAPRRNPSGPDLALLFTLASDAPARLRLLDAAGRLVAEVQLNASAREWSFGRAAAPGLYFAELTQGRERRVTKLVTLH